MLYPSIEEVKKLAADYTIIPVLYEFTADHQTPINIYRFISQKAEQSFLLESVSNGEQWGRYSFIGASPKEEVLVQDGKFIRRSGGKEEVCEAVKPFQMIRDLMEQQKSPKYEDAPNFTGGMIGYFGYDMVRFVEKKLVNVNEDDLHMPDCHLFLYETLIAYDHLRSRGIIIQNLHVNDNLDAQYTTALWKAEALARDIQQCGNCLQASKAVSGETIVHSNTDMDSFTAMVDEAKEYIRSGDIFQIVLSQRFELTNIPDSFDVYRQLRAENPSPYLYYFKTPDYAIAGASPEMLVRVENGRVYNRPIAGTKARGKTRAEDLENERILRNDKKEQAEHMMLVDLGRNDVGKVSKHGSVEVTRCMVTERASKVMHLVSDVEGVLQDDKTALDALMAVLPAGTLSGAPKVRAMELIDHFETKKRGLYGGTVGYLGFDGNIDTCIAIRTVLFKNEKAYMQAGAGIVIDSVPENEYYETVNKALAGIRAVKEAGKA